MSVITEAVIVASDLSPAEFTALIAPLPFDTERGQCFQPIDMGKAGGTKLYTGHVFAAALNHVASSDLIEWFRDLPWVPGAGAVLTFHAEGSFRRIVTLGTDLRI